MGYSRRLWSTVVLAGAIVATNANAECFMRSATGIKKTLEVQRIDVINQMVVPNPAGEGNTCSVIFKLQVNAQWLTGYGSYDMAPGETEAQGCKVALELGKRELLDQHEDSLGSTVLQTEKQMVCSDERGLDVKPTEIGDRVRESQVQPDPRRPEPFYHTGTICKRYIETSFEEGGLYQWHGVICKLAEDTWVVTDKW